MKRREFIEELEDRLRHLPYKDRKEAVKFYEEYFDEAGVENEQNVINELRSPAHIASKILSDYAVKEAEGARKSARGGLRAIWFTILGIFAAPIAIPVAVALTIVIVLLCVGLCVACVALIFGGGILAVFGFGMLFVDFGTGVLLIGLILVAIGLTRLLYFFVTAIIKKISQLVKKI
ncbi:MULTISPECIES: DUF1700 domain-containing protein [unclassified Treponema]|uniref:DUF1700 domain-containing protein n=1 Tax=unclassified Treponema TaxID=2638727 RepID=UPI0020A510E6|nr:MULTISPECIES: DUF1700 domain-containing protein [unclassified Treponema]UTC67628.1 DUF1700 domain-containing protein [Treponema sp. OMZ 789]UTC70356.1 DUF1700 domain-containing protein [Treponema sp. OMZ 790]UTC73070.1 DUF1700 domain-containing protein [Treponema sp. OMZ 791]